MRIGILGGSFNPPHLGHLLISMQVKQILKLDEIWLMPMHKHPFDKTLAPAEHRLAMSKLLENEFIKVSKFELNRNEKNYTINTLEHFTKRHPEYDFYWILGSDQLERFREFKNWQELISKYNIVIFPREYILPEIETQVKSSFRLNIIPENIIILKSAELIMSNISSSIIRHRIKNLEPITYLVPEKVEEYIIKNNLYTS